MSVVEVSGLSKTYGNQLALDELSFSLEPGTILGLLGSNGAGKTTTMKILSCFLPQSSGSAFVCGMDVQKEATKIKQKIGYLPEHNPLYGSMFVTEYLSFIGGIHKIENRKQRVEDIIELTGLTKERNKRIGDLSKGYKQRVGLSQALIHNPEVLILDEPTSGLDPIQLTDMRKLIREIGREKTIIFSSHVMQEIDALCDEVLILHDGKCLIHDTVSKLKQDSINETSIRFEIDQELSIQDLEKIEGISSIKLINPYTFDLQSSDKVKLKKTLTRFCYEKKLSLVQLHENKPNMEQIFLNIINQQS